ncbi:MAG: MBL fold metallo-hydrolase, partial [Anaerolineae bacterium]|nr:MBL fold metallo-hydrolase [Anaerolineae bacterium]
MKIQYFNWSGICLQHGNTLIGFDLYGEAVTWDTFKEPQTLILCLTHGHPEHAGSLRTFLEAPEANARLRQIHLISSPEVTRHVNRNSILPPQQVYGVTGGESITIDGVRITAFNWVHMPLLPPGIRNKASYILQLAMHPVDLIRIGILGLRLPMHAPQIGFHIAYPDGTTVLNYSEGVHRLTDPREVEQIGRNLPAQMVFFAVEPDDMEVIPRWVQMLAPEEVYLYEAHRPWRDLFHLPFIDLNDYAHKLSERFETVVFRALTRTEQ